MKHWAEDSSATIGKTASSRFGVDRSHKIARSRVEKAASDSTIRAIKPRLEASIVHKKFVKRGTSSSRKIQPSKKSKKAEGSVREFSDEKVAAVEEKIEKLTSEAERLKAQVDELTKRKRRLELENHMTAREKEQTRQSMSSLLEQNRDLMSENVALKEQVRDDQNELGVLRKKVAELEANLKNLRDDNRLLTEANLRKLKQLEEVGHEKRDRR